MNASRQSFPDLDKGCSVIWVKWSLFKKRYACGHKSGHVFSIDFFGHKIEKIRNNDLCPECFAKRLQTHTIFCAFCGLPIMPTEAVCLSSKDCEYIPYKDRATFYQDHVIGCMRMKCCAPGVFNGHWTDKGFKPATFGKF